jgi:hypothetical protein
VTTSHRKRPVGVTVGLGVLMLQALTVPFAMASAVRPVTDQPTWLGGLFLAADLAALAALGFIALGRRTHGPVARFAPTVLVAPAWTAIAVVSPLFHDALGAAGMYSVYALVVAALSSVPFLTKSGQTLFAPAEPSRATSGPGLTAGPVG